MSRAFRFESGYVVRTWKDMDDFADAASALEGSDALHALISYYKSQGLSPVDLCLELERCASEDDGETRGGTLQ